MDFAVKLIGIGECVPELQGLPALAGLGFAGVLGPTRGGVAGVGYSPPIFSFVGAHPPCPLGGGCAPSTPSLNEGR